MVIRGYADFSADALEAPSLTASEKKQVYPWKAPATEAAGGQPELAQYRYAVDQKKLSVIPARDTACPPGTVPGRIPGTCFPVHYSAMSKKVREQASKSMYSPTEATPGWWMREPMPLRRAPIPRDEKLAFTEQSSSAWPLLVAAAAGAWFTLKGK